MNWAASGTGLGIVSLADGFSLTGSEWWLSPGSFLAAELAGTVAYFQDESVVIPGPSAPFPINEALTTSGLGNWQTSSHSGFTSLPTGYTSKRERGHPGAVGHLPNQRGADDERPQQLADVVAQRLHQPDDRLHLDQRQRQLPGPLCHDRGRFVTIVTASNAGGCTPDCGDPVGVPVPAALFVFGFGLLALAGARRVA